MMGMGTMTELMKTQDVADWLQMSKQLVNRLVKAREIPGFRVGGSFRFEVEALRKWMEGK
jgi:excisionase family DNA binding protein